MPSPPSTSSTGATRLPATCCCSTRRRGCCSPTPTSRPRTPARSAAIATAPQRRRSISRSTVRSRGRTPDVARSPTVHLGGTRAEVGGERERRRARRGHRAARTCSRCSRRCSTRRARPRARQVLWAYIHVPAGLPARSDRTRHPAGRAIRAGLPRPHPRVARDDRGRARGVQPVRHRRRHPRRRVHFVQAIRRPVVSTTPVAHADARRLPRVGIHSARARSHRNAGLVRGPPGHRATPAPAASNPTDLFGA